MSRLISLSTNNGAFLYSLYQHATMYTKEKTVVFMHANEKKKKKSYFFGNPQQARKSSATIYDT